MTILLKILVYIIIIAGIIFFNIKYSFVERLGIPRVFIALFFFSLYLFLLYLEVKSNKRKGLTVEVVKRNGFIFSFWIGVLWGILTSFSAGFHYKISPFILIGMLIGYAIFGFLFGILGRFIARIIVEFNRDQTIRGHD